MLMRNGNDLGKLISTLVSNQQHPLALCRMDGWHSSCYMDDEQIYPRDIQIGTQQSHDAR